tara:strand:- start:19656 stop:19910 length:255 start_codon:yes stop_codon:yes gene_type:complete
MQRQTLLIVVSDLIRDPDLRLTGTIFLTFKVVLEPYVKGWLNDGVFEASQKARRRNGLVHDKYAVWSGAIADSGSTGMTIKGLQ